MDPANDINVISNTNFDSYSIVAHKIVHVIIVRRVALDMHMLASCPFRRSYCHTEIGAADQNFYFEQTQCSHYRESRLSNIYTLIIEHVKHT